MNTVPTNYYRALLEVTNILNSQRNSDSFWKAITGQIRHIIPWERAGITLYHPEIDAFRFYVVETSLPKVVLQSDMIIPREGSAIGWVYENKKIHIRPWLQEEQVFLEDQYYFQEGLSRMINLPMLVGDTCIGTLNIGSVQSGDPDPEDLGFLGQVATQIGLAIDHVQAYEQIDLLRQQLAEENQYLQEEIRATHNFGAIIGSSHVIEQIQELAEAVAPTNTTVLITGETGTGKELLARLIHELSPRREKAFIRVNCAGLPVGLVESELFGHERGAFTGAEQRRIGRFELAHGGTLFLDEIGEMSLEAQAKLLRVLQDGLIDRLGAMQSVPVDVRIIAATNSDLSVAVANGRFRSDLFFRLHVFPIHVPPLRERSSDILLLTRYFMDQFKVKFKRSCHIIEEDCLERLLNYTWPGNVRELQNVIERAMILSSGPDLKVSKALLQAPTSQEKSSGSQTLKDSEKSKIIGALESAGWRISGPSGAAARLGINASTLRSRMKKLAISRPMYAVESLKDFLTFAFLPSYWWELIIFA